MAMGRLLCMFAVVACGRIHFDPHGELSPCDWAFRRQLSFDNSAQSETLAGFPVQVRLDSSRVDYEETRDSGEDLRFTDSDGETLLPHEIEVWNESGTSIVWVRVPEIDASSTTDHIWMYYGNPAAESAVAPASVWSSSYVGVWHLNDDPRSGAADQIRDSTATALHGVAHPSMTADDLVAGQIGGGLDFDGIDDFVTTRDIEALDGIQQLTATAWVRVGVPNNNAAYPSIVAKGVTTTDLWALVEGGSGIGDNDDIGVMIRISGSGGGPDGATTPNLLVPGVWNQWTMVFDGTQLTNSQRLKVYFNGAAPMMSYRLTTPAMLPSTPGPVNIGQRELSGWYFSGTIDEVRLANVARSAPWVAAQYLSQIDAFVTFSEPMRPSACMP